MLCAECDGPASGSNLDPHTRCFAAGGWFELRGTSRQKEGDKKDTQTVKSETKLPNGELVAASTFFNSVQSVVHSAQLAFGTWALFVDIDDFMRWTYILFTLSYFWCVPSRSTLEEKFKNNIKKSLLIKKRRLEFTELYKREREKGDKNFWAHHPRAKQLRCF